MRGLRRSCKQCAKAPRLREEWNCEPSTRTVAIVFEGHPELELKLDRCYARYRSEEVWLVSEARAGRSLFGVGLVDEPAAVAEAVAFLDWCFAEAEGLIGG